MGEIHHQHWQAALVVFNDRSLYMGYTTSEALNQQREAILAIVNPGLVLWKKGVEIKDMNFESLIPVLNAVKNPQEAGRHARLFFHNRDITGPRGTSIIASFPDGRLGVFQTRGVEPHTLLSAAIMAGADSIGSFDGGGSTFMAVKTKDGDVHVGPPTTENRPMRAFGVVKSPA